MNKKLILLAALLLGISVVAMERIKEMPFAKEASHHEAQVNIRLIDSQNPETAHEVEIPVRLAKLIGAFNEFVEDPHFDPVWSLPNVAITIWRIIEPHLERVYGIIHDASQAAQLREAIMIDFRKLDTKSLVGVIYASDYLEIPILLESACEVLKQSAPEKISWEEIELLPSHIRNQIIMNKVVMLLGAVSGSELVVCRGHRGAVLSVYVTEDGKILSGSADDTVRVWDMQGNHLAVCKGHEDGVTSVCVTKDGKIVSGAVDATVRVWDIQGNQLAICRGHRGVLSVYITKDGKIVSGSRDSIVRVWDMEGNQLAECRGHKYWVTSVCVTKDGKIVTGSYDLTVRVWDMQGNELAVCRGHEGSVTSVCVTEDGKIVSGSRDSIVRVWDMEGNQLAVCRGHAGGVTSVCVTKKAKILSGSDDKTVRVWDMEGNQLAVCRGHEGEVESVFVTSDCKIVAGSQDRTVRVWDTRLLDRIMYMDEDQAQLVWDLLQRISKRAEIDKQKCWREIEKILGEDAPMAAANINNNDNE